MAGDGTRDSTKSDGINLTSAKSVEFNLHTEYDSADDVHRLGAVQLSDFRWDVIRGKVRGLSSKTIEGHNPSVSAGVDEALWDYGGLNNYLDAPTELFLSSTSALDTNVSLHVIGLDANYDLVEMPITFTSGQSQQSIGLWLRCFKVSLWVGGDVVLGDIFVAESDTLVAGVPQTDTKVQNLMSNEEKTSHKFAYTVPAGHSMIITSFSHGVRKNGDAIFKFRIRPESFTDFLVVSLFPTVADAEYMAFISTNLIPEKTDIELLITTDSNNTECMAQAGYILIDNSIAI